MRYSTYINNQKCLDWGLNANQGALFDLLNQAVSWAKPIHLHGQVFYWVSREKVIEELPLFYSKPDTVYRHFKELDEKGLVVYQKYDDMDLIALTEKGKTWNEFDLHAASNSSDSNPTLGNKSESTRKQIRNSSDSNPTDKYINNKNTKDHNNSSSGKNFPPAAKGKKYSYSDDDLKAAEWIFSLIKNLNPNFKNRQMAPWANEIRLMRERDKRTHREICELFRWANQDSFWSANILSPVKLREKWDQLVMKRQSCKTTKHKESFAEKNARDWASPEKMAEVF